MVKGWSLMVDHTFLTLPPCCIVHQEDEISIWQRHSSPRPWWWRRRISPKRLLLTKYCPFLIARYYFSMWIEFLDNLYIANDRDIGLEMEVTKFSSQNSGMCNSTYEMIHYIEYTGNSPSFKFGSAASWNPWVECEVKPYTLSFRFVL